MGWLPDPLHPAVVHLPIALALLVPIFAISSVIQVRLTGDAGRTWVVVALLQLMLVGSAWLALETGERDEERVEAVVAERHIEAHEESAERFHLAGIAALVFVLGGLAPGGIGSVARGVALLATLGVLALGVQTGHVGGELVYRHGAASAYAGGAHDLAGAPPLVKEPRHHDD